MKGHNARMRAARAARRANGLNENFAEQTRVQAEIDGLKRFLDYLKSDDLPETFRAELKERAQGMVASHAETLYHLRNGTR